MNSMCNKYLIGALAAAGLMAMASCESLDIEPADQLSGTTFWHGIYL